MKVQRGKLFQNMIQRQLAFWLVIPAIVSHLRRTDDREGRQTALVWITQIFAPGRTYRLNLAYRESEAGIWNLVIERIKASIRIEATPGDE